MVREVLGKNPVIVVAHADDEVMWCGGLPIRNPDLNWTVIVCSIPRRDPQRAWQFFDACEQLGTKGRILPFVEGGRGQPLVNLHLLDLEPYDSIVTHGAEGEYGHLQHQQVHNYIVSKIQCAKRVVTFNYGKGGSHALILNEEEAAKKLKALKCYSGPSVGTSVPKWQALIDRYCNNGFCLEVERYSVI